jgi:hypothetical protein
VTTNRSRTTGFLLLPALRKEVEGIYFHEGSYFNLPVVPDSDGPAREMIKLSASLGGQVKIPSSNISTGTEIGAR